MFDKIKKLIVTAYQLKDSQIMSNCANKIAWATQFAKITKTESGILADMVSGYYDHELYYDRKGKCLRYADNDQIAKWAGVL